MDAIWTTGGTGSGLLPEARHRLSTLATALGALQADTAWDCRAADAYRAWLEALVGEVRELCGVAHDLEADLKALWQRAAATGSW